MRSEGYSSWSVSVCLSVCLSVDDYSRTTGYEAAYGDTNSFSATRE